MTTNFQRWVRLSSVLCLALALFGAAPAHACLLVWTPPTTNVDGTSLTDLAGYYLYFQAYGTVGGVRQAETVSSLVISVTITCQHGTYWMTAFNALGIESDASNAVATKKSRRPMTLAITR